MIRPMNLFWVLMIFAYIFRFRKRSSSQKAVYIAVFWIALTGTKWVPDLMVHSLEKRYAVFEPNNQNQILPVQIMVLGGGGSYDITKPAQERLSSMSLARLTEGVRLYLALPGSKMIFSGFSGRGGVTQASLMKSAAMALGVTEKDIEILEKPSTTEEEAQAYHSTYGHREIRLILVTSDIHMPRSMFLFQKQGLKPIAAPGDHILKTSFMPSVAGNAERSHFWWESGKGNFEKFSLAMHEYIGLVWARLK
ncbi:MAG: YdcF family protein [Saprospiraceae bacterium]|nr:YdcF family protein [Saprospiraceae bacterium]